MFLQVDKDLFGKDLNPLEILIYAQISEFNRTTGKCYVTDKQFAEMFGSSERTVKRTIKKLEDEGWITRETKAVPGGGKMRLLAASKGQNDPSEKDDSSKGHIGPSEKVDESSSKGHIGPSTKGHIGPSTKGHIGPIKYNIIENINEKDNVRAELVRASSAHSSLMRPPRERSEWEEQEERKKEIAAAFPW